jgi:hypothetical protein
VFVDNLAKTVMLEDRSNWAKLNAINANHVQLDRLSTLLLTIVQSKDQPVIATNNITRPPTNVKTAPPVNSQTIMV